MRDEELKQLTTVFGPEKEYVKDGYYRIRYVSESEVELAFLIADGCGTTSVHPQITLEKSADIWHPVKLIDMATSPTQFVDYSEETSEFIEEALEELVKKFENVL